MRIGIIADLRLLAEGLRSLIQSDDSLRVVVEADSKTAATALRAETADVVIAVRGADAADDLCRRLLDAGIGSRMVVLGAGPDDRWAIEALRAGARGILTSSAIPSELLKAIHTVHRGDIHATSSVIARLVETFATELPAGGDRRAEAPPPSGSLALSARQFGIVQRIAAGATNQEIAAALGISAATVKAHLAAIFQKLGIRRRTQLLALYHKGLVRTTQPASASDQSG